MNNTIKESTRKAFIDLIRLGIGHEPLSSSHSFAWASIKSLAEAQGLSAIVLDGIEGLRIKAYNVVLPEKKFLTQWIGEVLHGYEYRYELYRRAIAEMAGFYNLYGFKMMVLKGYACSLDWPKPEHRPTGDIDIWQFGRQKEADVAVSREKGIEVDNSHHHHTVFYWRDFMVENHYDFINVHYGHKNAEIEKILKELGRDNSHYVELYGEKVYLPSSNLHALFLLRHALLHFAMPEMNMRQVLDWAFFVEKHSDEIDWPWLINVSEQYHMTEFLSVMNAICKDDLGFSCELFPPIQYNPIIKDRVLSDILTPEFQETLEPGSGIIKRVLYKYRRWKASAWKLDFCFGDGMFKSFISGVWNHLLKPSSI